MRLRVLGGDDELAQIEKVLVIARSPNCLIELEDTRRHQVLADRPHASREGKALIGPVVPKVS